MSNQDIKQAKEWAKESVYFDDSSGFASAVRGIQSLPDQWVDAERVRWILHKYAYRHATGQQAANILNDLESLLTPSLPTLADLIEQGNDQQQYQWMQCNVEGRGDDTFVIAVVGERVNKVLLPDGLHEVKGNNQVTPLPDLPKLEWPAQVPRNPETPPAETLNNASSDTPRNPRPEDVPEGEPWLVEFNGHKWVGTREATDQTGYPWALSRLDGVTIAPAKEVEVTLVSRLVPEVAA